MIFLTSPIFLCYQSHVQGWIKLIFDLVKSCSYLIKESIFFLKLIQEIKRQNHIHSCNCNNLIFLQSRIFIWKWRLQLPLEMKKNELQETKLHSCKTEKNIELDFHKHCINVYSMCTWEGQVSIVLMKITTLKIRNWNSIHTCSF